MKDQYPNKIFCIGMNKTGTTSMKKALEAFGYKVGVQAEAKIIAIPTQKGKFSYLLNYCKAAEAFQDVPFSRRNVYKILDEHFPDAKFILTVRDNADTWYESLIRFQKKGFRRMDCRPESEIAKIQCIDIKAGNTIWQNFCG